MIKSGEDVTRWLMHAPTFTSGGVTTLRVSPERVSNHSIAYGTVFGNTVHDSLMVTYTLPPQMVAELNDQDEGGNDEKLKVEALPPPTLPDPAFHFNKKVPLRVAPTTVEDLRTRLAQVEA